MCRQTRWTPPHPPFDRGKQGENRCPHQGNSSRFRVVRVTSWVSCSRFLMVPNDDWTIPTIPSCGAPNINASTQPTRLADSIISDCIVCTFSTTRDYHHQRRMASVPGVAGHCVVTVVSHLGRTVTHPVGISLPPPSFLPPPGDREPTSFPRLHFARGQRRQGWHGAALAQTPGLKCGALFECNWKRELMFL